MGRSDWSSEQLAQELAHGFSLLARMELGGGLAKGESTALADGVLQCMNSTLLKVSEALEAQTHLRAEIQALKGALKEAEAARAALERGSDDRMLTLESEVRQLRDERRRLADALDLADQREAAPGGVARPVCPRIPCCASLWWYGRRRVTILASAISQGSGSVFVNFLAWLSDSRAVILWCAVAGNIWELAGCFPWG